MLPGLEGHIIGVVGWRGSGKTTIVEGLVEFLGGRGFTAGTLKHVDDEIALPSRSKDSMRHLKAGARLTVTAGDRLLELLMRGSTELETLVRHLWFCDYVVVEGFKTSGIPKIAVSDGQGLPDGLEQVVAVVYRENKPNGLAAFRFDEIERLGTYLFEQGVLTEDRQRIALMVNGKGVPINEFVQTSLAGVIRGFLASLKGVEKPSTIQINIKM
jgi:molybdopterin-guanine dinucleotide biosynthesis protein B